ncbi:RNA polymerase sigma factor SigX [Halobacillus litoralis]|uniref:RNA polymerase sigma factor n=1 Tax=Halobacillus litoralis TaxID=45668 RepID=A0A845FBT3_9BACI|nr:MULTISPECIES: RNA polymerase sigma factor SigX [Halobacillus]MEC3884705.1 RNA polymerase sigma factor SigX [Halobacillus sp. HZG1]MYL71244.1 RNA polymerase sigma factor SigX [Halobacillus litoralis]
MRTFFDELYDNYHHDLFQFLVYMVKDRSLAEDLVQDVYVRVMKSYESFNGKSSEKTWLFSIARHVAIDYFRKQKRKRNRFMEFFDWTEKGEQIKDQNKMPEEIAVQNDEIQRVYQALDQCTVDQRSVLIFRFIQGMSIKETAEILSWSESKVKTTQHRAMKALKMILEDMEEGRGNREEA